MSRALLTPVWLVVACLLVLALPASAAAQDSEVQEPGTEVVDPQPAPEEEYAEDGWEDGDEGEEWWPAEDEEAVAPPAVPPTALTPPPPPAPLIPTIPVPTTRTIKGRIAYVRADGKAAIPRQAPKRVRRVIAAANEIVGKPYKWGGGHARLVDKGYDCSGTVGYALIRAGLLATTMTSGQLARYGSRHAGRHITIYANKGHVYMEVAGLRLDTSPVNDPTGQKGPRWRPAIGRRAGFRTRHPIGL